MPVNAVNREVGFVPQQAQLFPWKTLAENVELPLLLRGVAAAERRQRVAAALEAVGLTGFEHYFPNQLSGGMQKRGSIARTLVYRPDVILMDEPFGALDAQTRMVMQDDLQMLSRDAGATVLFVTHDITEAVLAGRQCRDHEPAALAAAGQHRDRSAAAAQRLRAVPESRL